MDTGLLSDTFTTASSYAEWSTIVVAIGVFIELGALFVFSKSMPPAEKAVLVFATALITAGCVGEYIFGSRANHAANELQQASDRTVAGLKAQQEADHKIATEAAAHAADLGVSIDTLHSFVQDEKKKNDDVIAELQSEGARLSKARDDALAAAEASKIVLDKMNVALDAERVIREKMLTVITPRNLTATGIAPQLASFAPMQVDIFTFGDTKEITDLGRVLVQALTAAGWQPRIWAEMNGASAGVTGVPILVRPGADTTISTAANALALALQGQQISAAVVVPTGNAFDGTKAPGNLMGPPWDPKNVADLRVFIGAKP